MHLEIPAFGQQKTPIKSGFMRNISFLCSCYGGEEEIRTLEPCYGLHDFQKIPKALKFIVSCGPISFVMSAMHRPRSAEALRERRELRADGSRRRTQGASNSSRCKSLRSGTNVSIRLHCLREAPQRSSHPISPRPVSLSARRGEWDGYVRTDALPVLHREWEGGKSRAWRVCHPLPFPSPDFIYNTTKGNAKIRPMRVFPYSRKQRHIKANKVPHRPKFRPCGQSHFLRNGRGSSISPAR